MALLFMEGWDDMLTNDHIASSENMTAVSAPNVGAGRFGSGRALLVQNALDDIYCNWPESTATFYCGMAIKANLNAASATYFVRFYTDDDQDDQFALTLTTSGQIQVLRDITTVLGTTTGTWNLNQWNYVVCKIFISNTVGTVELWLNGTKEINLTNQDTQAQVNATIRGCMFTGPSGLDLYIDDFYAGDDSGSDMTDQQGDCVVELLLPDGTGNRNNFTASPAVAANLNVDEQTPDDDTTYNHSATATDAELYTTAAITGAVDTVHAVKVRVRARKEDAGDRLVNTILRSSTTESDSGQKGLSTDYRYIENIHENDPNGGGAWTESAVNACEVGLEIGT